MSELVELEHPTMPGQTIHVHEAGVWHRERAGWRRLAGEQTHPGIDEPLEVIEHPADGTTSPEVAADPTPARSKAAGSRSTDDSSDDTTETER